MTAAARIQEFNQRLVVPLFEEIRTSARMRDKGRNLGILTGLRTGDASFDDALSKIHAQRRSLSELTGDESGEWVGHTLVLIEAPEKRAPYTHPHAGHFFLSVVFRTGGPSVCASPWVLYWMRFNDKLHAFAHRYDNAIANHPIEELTRAHLLNHALNAITFFDIHAFSETRPF